MDDPVGFVAGILAYLYFSVCVYFMAKKAGEDNAWFAFIPILNIVILLMIADMPLWWLVLCIIPIVNLVAFAMIWMGVARGLGKPSWTGLLIFVPLVNLGFLGWLAFS